MGNYVAFLQQKARVWNGRGIVGAELPKQLFDWQRAITRWTLKKGRAAIFADCGLGKTFMQVAWAQALNVPTLILAPLCVAEQTVLEGAKLGINLRYCRNSSEAEGEQIVITNYERLDGFDS